MFNIDSTTRNSSTSIYSTIITYFNSILYIQEIPAVQDKRNLIKFNININLKLMQTFIIVSLMILVIVILILYVHKVIKYSHLEEDLRIVFNNLTNINAYINTVSQTQSQSPNTEIKETEITNVNTDLTIKEITD